MSDNYPRPRAIDFPRNIDGGVEPSGIIRVPPPAPRIVPKDQAPPPPAQKK